MNVTPYLHLFTDNVVDSKQFFENIGLTILDAYSNEQGFCIALNKNAYIMVLDKSRFQSFHPRLTLAQSDVHSSFISLEMESIEDVDALMRNVIKHGGVETDNATEDEWVYYRSFKDIDAHQFEVFFMKKK